jgi:hypothetical protein
MKRDEVIEEQTEGRRGLRKLRGRGEEIDGGETRRLREEARCDRGIRSGN